MNKLMLLAVILLPVIGGGIAALIPFKNRKYRNIFLELLVLAVSAMVWWLLFDRP